MKMLLRLLWRLVSVTAHVSTWVVTLAAFAIGIMMVALVATGTKPIVITSGSMVPIIPVRAVVLAHQVDASEIKVGDIVTLPLPQGGNVTHRVMTTEDKGSFTEITMKGDANKAFDPVPYKVTSGYRLVTVMPGVGQLLMDARSPTGLAALGVLFGCTMLSFFSHARNLRRRSDEEEIDLNADAMEIDVRLQELERQKGAFITSVNQDLRTPLTSIMGYLELLSEGDFGDINDTQRDALSAVKRNADRLHGLVGNMLTAAEIESGQLHVSLDLEVDATDILYRVQENFDLLARDRSIDFEVIVTEELGMVQGSSDQIKSCIDQLVSNALKFTPSGGKVTVRAFNGAGLLNIAVSDTGAGIQRRHVKDLFSKFFRTPTADEEATSGSGLGLTIVKAIVRAYNGSITVDSVQGIGSTFTIKLPTVARAKVLASET